MLVQLYPHQQKAVDSLHNGSILVGGVGTGKSITALAYFFTKVCKGVLGDPGSMRTPRDLIIITTAKKRDSTDWQRDAANMYLGKDADASAGAVQVTVDSWNNIQEYTHIENAFFIFDEQRVVGKGSWAKNMIKIAKKNEWILLSATPGDTWMDYVPVFIANGFYKNRSEFMRQHVVWNTFGGYPKVDHYVEVGTLIRHRKNLLVEMPYQRHTKRHIHDIIVGHDKTLFEQVVEKKWHVYEDRPLTDAAELFRVMRKVVNSDSSRITELRSLMEKHPRLIVFYNFDYELEALRGLGKSITSTGPEKITLDISSDSDGSDVGACKDASEWTEDRLEAVYGPLRALSGGSEPYVQTTMERINNLRRILHTHSYIYYNLHTNLITDAKFDSFSNELVELQAKHPELVDSGYEPEMFADWTGDTGMHLPITDYVMERAEWLIQETHRRASKSSSTPLSMHESSIESHTSDRTKSSSTSTKSKSSDTQSRSTPSLKKTTGSTDETSSKMTVLELMLSEEENEPEQSTRDLSNSTSSFESDSSRDSKKRSTTRFSTGTGQNSRPLGLSGPVASPEIGSTQLSSASISETVFAEWNGKKHEEVPDSERWVYLVQYTAGSEGWNCIATDAIVFYSLTYSYKAFEQSQGRIDRLNTKFVDLHYYVFRSKSLIDTAIAKSLKAKRNFNENAFTKSNRVM